MIRFSKAFSRCGIGIQNPLTKKISQKVVRVNPILSCRTYGALAEPICERNKYEIEYQKSMETPENFWLEQSQKVDWFQKPVKAIENTPSGTYTWFPDATLNTSYNCLDRHVLKGNGDKPAIIFHSVYSDRVIQKTYNELLKETELAAGGLKKLGVAKGDRVLIYMPNSVEAIVSMMACARLGAVHTVVFGGFGAKELSIRIDHCEPRVVLAASCGIEPRGVIPYQPLVDEGLKLATHKPSAVVYNQRSMCRAELTQSQHIDWDQFTKNVTPAPPVEVYAKDPLYILYTSGTTGQPKGVVRDNGGHAVATLYSMKNVYDMKEGEVFWGASDVGWVVGHSFMVYGPLLHGCPSVIFEGKPVTPNAGIFWKVVEKYKVKTMVTAPTALRAICREDPNADLVADHDISSLEGIYCAGEHLDPATENHYHQKLNLPIIDHYWQTESGWPIVANCKGLHLLPTIYGAAGKAVPGWKIEVMNPKGEILDAEERGELAFKLPLPPGSLLGLYKGFDKFQESYLKDYPGWYKTGDNGYKNKDGYIYVMSRTDDVINVAGHRLSTGVMEDILLTNKDVSEAAVFGVNCAIKGQIPFAFVVLKKENHDSRDDDIVKECIARVRRELGPVASFYRVKIVSKLPKTRSGKILRGVMTKMANGEDFKYPGTIDDPTALNIVSKALSDEGFSPSPIPRS